MWWPLRHPDSKYEHFKCKVKATPFLFLISNITGQAHYFSCMAHKYGGVASTSPGPTLTFPTSKTGEARWISPLADDVVRRGEFGFRREFFDAANKHQSMGAVLLDMSQVFDKVWHESFLFKLTQTSCVQFVCQLCIYYSRISVIVPSIRQCRPCLYLAYMNDMPIYPGLTLSLYADDTIQLVPLFHYSLYASVSCN